MSTIYHNICSVDNSLRNYQQEAKEKIFNEWDAVDNVMFQMPTGTGKTRLFTSIIRDIRKYSLRKNSLSKVLIIAHRTELIEQIDRSLNKYYIPHGIIAGIMKDRRDFTLPVQVASIQTIVHQSNRKYAENLNIDFIIIDEAHHAMAESYTKLWRLYPEAKKLGVTATPWRMNGVGFRQNFDSLILSMPIKKFISLGWLSSYKYYSISTNSEVKRKIDSIKEFDIEGDYKISALEREMDDDHIRAQLFDSYKKYAIGKKGIIYSISRNHSIHLCNKYRSEGVNIVNIDSETPSKVRERYVNEFKEGKIDVIVNVDIFSEGFDCPDIEFIQLARPTRSLVKYIQQVGRGLRINGNKKCVILDNVGMYARFGLPDADRDWETYFDGDNILSRVKHEHKEIELDSSEREQDLSEGLEEMILIQDVQSNANNVLEIESIEPTLQPKEKDITLPPNNFNEEVDNNSSEEEIKQFNVVSNSLFRSKFKIVDSNNGYYLLRIKDNALFPLTKLESHLRGSIKIIKPKNGELYYTIVRLIPTIKNRPDKQSIIGYLRLDGKLIKFFDSGQKSTDERIVVAI